jgi:hypothetical protein
VLLLTSHSRRRCHPGNGDLELEISNGAGISNGSVITSQEELDAIVEQQGQQQGQGKEKEKEKAKMQ